MVLLGGCAPNGWRDRPVNLVTPPFKPQAQIQVFSGGSMAQWHAVIVTRDSVSGIPYTMPIACASCRRSMPLIEVDSMRIRPASVGKEGAVITGAVVAALVVEYIVCSLAKISCG